MSIPNTDSLSREDFISRIWSLLNMIIIGPSEEMIEYLIKELSVAMSITLRMSSATFA